MEEKQHEIDRRIEAAIRSAIEAGITDIEEKIRAAIKVGVEVGAAAAAEAAYATASKIAARERRKLQSQRKDKRYHDIKLLVRKYRQLNAYYENAVYDEESAAEVDEDLEEIMNIFGQKYRAEDKRRWRVLHDLYLAEEPSTAEQIASREKIDRRTVYKDIDACLSDLSVLFFGIDGLDQAFP